MNTASKCVEDATDANELRQTRLERCQRELSECRGRLGQLEQRETLLAGEDRVLLLLECDPVRFGPTGVELAGCWKTWIMQRRE